MPLNPVTSDTGDAVLADIGTLSYNGVVFSALYKSVIDGKDTPDAAGRTVRYVDYTLTVDGVVTLSAPQATTDATWETLRLLLSQQAATLTYSGKGFGDVVINPAGGGGVRDVAWGPVPEVLYFQPLGASRSANIRWQVKFRVAENQRSLSPDGGFSLRAGPPGNFVGADIAPGANLPAPLVQYNWESSLTYDDEGFASWSIKGTMEMPLTRNSAEDRSVTRTVDDLRSLYLNFAVDLTRFRVARRNFHVSRDKRTCEWELLLEEIPYMGQPWGCTSADGSFQVRPVEPGAGIVHWMCTLKASYTVRKDWSRWVAYWNFMGMLQTRFAASQAANILPPADNPDPAPQNAPPAPGRPAARAVLEVIGGPGAVIGGFVGRALGRQARRALDANRQVARIAQTTTAIMHSFSVDEGLYRSSRKVSFEASWQLFSSWSCLLQAAGVWRMSGMEGGNVWAQSVSDIMGWSSWLEGRLDPNQDAIVDLGM